VLSDASAETARAAMIEMAEISETTGIRLNTCAVYHCAS
jgi:hypothetical protein